MGIKLYANAIGGIYASTNERYARKSFYSRENGNFGFIIVIVQGTLCKIRWWDKF